MPDRLSLKENLKSQSQLINMNFKRLLRSTHFKSYTFITWDRQINKK